MLQFFNKKVELGNYNRPESWSEDAEACYRIMSFRHFAVGRAERWEDFEPIFPGFGHLYAPLWDDLGNKILTTIKIVDGDTALFNTIKATTGRIIYVPFLRSYHEVGEKIADGVYFSKKGGIKLTEFMLLKVNKIPDEVLTEWSGVPVDRLGDVYDGGVAFIKSLIESIAREEASKKRGHTVIYYPRPEVKNEKPGWRTIEE